MNVSTSFRSQLETRLNSSVNRFELVAKDQDLDAAVVVGPLSAVEVHLLNNCEKIIRKGLDGFKQVGAALEVVWRDRLFRAEFRTFREYLDKKWGLSPRRALQLRDAAEVMENPSLPLPLPSTESQARVLAGLPKAEQPKVWKAALEMAAPGKPTARVVQSVIDESANRRVGASAILKPEPRVEQKPMKAWPQPNVCGVYSQDDPNAEEFGYRGTKVEASIFVLQTGPDRWAFALHVGYSCGDMSSYRRPLRLDFKNSREEAIRTSARILEDGCFRVIKDKGSVVNATQRESARRMRAWAVEIIEHPPAVGQGVPKADRLKPEPQTKPEAAPKPQNKLERLIEATQRAKKAVSVLQGMLDRSDTDTRSECVVAMTRLEEVERKLERKLRRQK